MDRVPLLYMTLRTSYPVILNHIDRGQQPVFVAPLKRLK